MELGELVTELQRAGDVQAVRTLATRVAELEGFGDLGWYTDCLEQFQPAGEEALRILLPASWIRQATALGPAGNTAWLLGHLTAAGTGDLAQALLDRDPGGQASLDDLGDIARLIAALHAAGDTGAARALAARAAADAPQASLADPVGTADLLTGLRTAGYDEAARALLNRDPARQARLERRHGVARLIAALRAAGAGEAAATLARRAAGARPVQRLPVRAPGPRGQLPLRLRAGPGARSPWRWSPPLHPRRASPGQRALAATGTPG